SARERPLLSRRPQESNSVFMVEIGRNQRGRKRKRDGDDRGTAGEADRRSSHRSNTGDSGFHWRFLRSGWHSSRYSSLWSEVRRKKAGCRGAEGQRGRGAEGERGRRGRQKAEGRRQKAEGRRQ